MRVNGDFSAFFPTTAKIVHNQKLFIGTNLFKLFSVVLIDNYPFAMIHMFLFYK